MSHKPKLRRPASPRASDRMGARHKSRLEEARKRELDTEIQVSRVGLLSCAVCGREFYAGELNPTCPECGTVLSRRRR